MLVTRKIELFVIGNKEEKSNNWSFIRQLNNDIFKAANQIISDQWFYEAFEEKVENPDLKKIEAYRDEIKNFTPKNAKEEKKLAKLKNDLNSLLSQSRNEAKQKLKELFEIGRQQRSWRLIADKYPEWGSLIFDSLVQKVYKDFSTDYIDVKQGNRSIRSYKKGLPIPFRARGRKFTIDEEGTYIFHWIKNIKFGIVFGRDRSSRKAEIDKIISGEYSFSDSSIQIKGKKLFLNLVLDHPKPKHILDENKILNVFAGIDVPLKWVFGKKEEVIGSADDILKFRMQQQSKYRRYQKRLKLTTGGKGRKKKLQKLNDFKKQETNWIKTYNHKLSKQVIRVALKYNTGTIHFHEIKKESLTDEQKKFEGRNWAGHQLKEMLTYKSKFNNINFFTFEFNPNESNEDSSLSSK